LLRLADIQAKRDDLPAKIAWMLALPDWMFIRCLKQPAASSDGNLFLGKTLNRVTRMNHIRLPAGCIFCKLMEKVGSLGALTVQGQTVDIAGSGQATDAKGDCCLVVWVAVSLPNSSSATN